VPKRSPRVPRLVRTRSSEFARLSRKNERVSWRVACPHHCSNQRIQRMTRGGPYGSPRSTCASCWCWPYPSGRGLGCWAEISHLALSLPRRRPPAGDYRPAPTGRRLPSRSAA
jgi:hypothetical protein